jgi:hypothetical protein
MNRACAPVLLLIFNRPDLAVAALAAIRAARPSRLYVAADGPRPGRPGEPELCERARRETLAAIDWPCEIKTLLRESNLGCARAVHGAVSWFFEQETEGIILEDDCIAAPAFFPFCSELLERYRTDRRVFAVAGDHFLGEDMPATPSYWFNGVFHVWGWASWRDRWVGVPLTVPAADADAIRSALHDAGLTRAETSYWTPVFARVRQNTVPEQRINSWAYPAAYHAMVNRFVCISPTRNLVTNVGFGADSTHFQGDSAGAGMRIAQGALDFPLTHPPAVRVNRALHRRNLRVRFGIRYGIAGIIEDFLSRGLRSR